MSGRAVHLTDFGLARDCTTGSRLTRTGATLGTPSYMSPEQARGNLSSLTPASDVWSLGCVLYECLSGGRRAFEGANGAAVVGAVLTQDPPALPAIPRAADRLVRVCLARSPAHRPARAAGLRDECGRVLRGEAPTLRPPAPVGVRRVAGAVVVLAAAVGSLAAWRGGQGAAPAERADDLAAQAERLAQEGWSRRVTAPSEGAAMLGQAVRHDPANAAWQLRLGELRWAAGDLEGAGRAWTRVSTGDRHATRAAWLQGLAVYTADVTVQRGEPASTVIDAWQRAAAGQGPERAWAAAGLALLRGQPDGAGLALQGHDSWECALLLGLAASRVRRLADDGSVEIADPAAAEQSFTRVLDEGLPLPWVYANRGLARLNRGNPVGAAADFERAIALQPDDGIGYYNRALIAVLREDWGRALADLDAALGRSPDLVEAWHNRALAHQRLGNVSEALRDYDEAIRRRPADSKAFYNRAQLWIVVGRTDRARTDLDQALALEPDAPRALRSRAVLRDQADDLPGALADARTLVRVRPGDAPAIEFLAHVQHRLGDAAAARRNLDAAVEADPAFHRAWMSRAILREQTGDLPGALEDYDRAEAAGADPVDVGYNRGHCLLRGGDPARALPVLDAVVQARPGWPTARLTRAAVYIELSRWSEALADCDAAIAASPRLADALLNRAIVHEALGDLQRSRDDLQAAAEAAPRDAELWYRLGRVEALRRDDLAAVTAFRRCLQLRPPEPLAERARAALDDVEGPQGVR